MYLIFLDEFTVIIASRLLYANISLCPKYYVQAAVVTPLPFAKGSHYGLVKLCLTLIVFCNCVTCITATVLSAAILGFCENKDEYRELCSGVRMIPILCMNYNLNRALQSEASK